MFFFVQKGDMSLQQSPSVLACMISVDFPKLVNFVTQLFKTITSGDLGTVFVMFEKITRPVGAVVTHKNGE